MAKFNAKPPEIQTRIFVWLCPAYTLWRISYTDSMIYIAITNNRLALLTIQTSLTDKFTTKGCWLCFMSQMVELVPGSGVYISASLFDEIEQEPNLKGSRLVRRLVYDIFPDEQLLAMSSCLGKGHQSSRQGLDQNKVDAIKG